jgi:hypothetical protein
MDKGKLTKNMRDDAYILAEFNALSIANFLVECIKTKKSNSFYYPMIKSSLSHRRSCLKAGLVLKRPSHNSKSS